MYPLNDNDLDRLSRDAADQYDVEPSTSGWEALENRLNKELPLKEEKERRRFLFWLFLFVLLAGAGLLWMMTGKNNPAIQMAHIKDTDGTAIPAQQDTKNTTPAASQPSPNVGIPQQDAANPAPTGDVPAPATASSTVTPPPITGKANEILPAPGEAKLSPVRSVTKASAPAPKNIQPDKTKKASRGRKAEKAPSSITGDLATVIGKTNDPKKVKETPDTREKDGAQAEENDHLLKASIVSGVDMETGRGAITAPPLPIPADKPEAPEKKQQQKNKGFEIGLVAGPDMSNVKFTDMDKVGYNVGIQIGYRFSDRWSANTGLLYTRKNYTAEGKDWTKTGWWRYTDIHTVQGYCQMFEIPLNVRYDLSVNKNQRWFVNAGASSYIMNSEYYNYDYTYNGTRYQRGWDRDSTSTYLFSILNLSAGFERTLNKRFSVQAEPYFKFPLKGLGYGKLDLTSYGIYFSLKYKLGKR